MWECVCVCVECMYVLEYAYTGSYVHMMPMDQLQVLFLLTLFCRVVFTRLAGQWPWSCLPALPNAGTVGTPLSTAFTWLLGLKPESWLCGERFPDKALSTSQGWGEGLVSRGPSCDQDQHCWIKVLSPQKRDFYDLPKTNPTSAPH